MSSTPSRSPGGSGRSSARTSSSSPGSSCNVSARTRRSADDRLDRAPMKFPSFDMERMQSTWEHRVKYDLSESGVEALTLEEITRDQKELMRAKIDRVVAIAAKHGAWILSDEVYRGAELDSTESASFSGRGERIVITGGLSKVYGLPGLRIGWLVAPEDEVQAALRLKDYTTIAPATISESLAQIALERRAELLKRARFILGERWPKLEDWAATHSRELHWTPPQAGGICFFSYRFPIESMALVDRLIREYSTMVVPGIHFRAERHLRIGFGMPARVLHPGLGALDRLLSSLD